MVDTTALGVSARRTDDGWHGCDDLTHRRIIAARWQSAGVVTGLAVQGTDSLAYQVSAGVAVVKRTPSDGATEAYFDGGRTPDVEANQSANPRIDCVWIMSHDHMLGDADNHVVVGVTQGTAAASPSKPVPPAGVTVLAYMQVPASSTTLQSATRVGDVDYATPYGVAIGRLGTSQVKQDTTITTTEREYCRMSVNLPTDRTLQFVVLVCATAAGLSGVNDVSKTAEVRGRVHIDGRPNGEMFNMAFRGCAESKPFVVTIPVAKGAHTVSVKLKRAGGVDAVVKYAGDFSGIKLDVIDQGVHV